MTSLSVLCIILCGPSACRVSIACDLAPFTVNIIHTSVPPLSFAAAAAVDRDLARSSSSSPSSKKFKLQRSLLSKWRGFLWTDDTFGHLIDVASRWRVAQETVD